MKILFIVLESFLLFTMTFGGGSKLVAPKNFIEMFDSLKLPQWFRVVTGLVQLAGAVGLAIGYWHPVVAAWAGIWLGITMLVACLAHFRVKHPIGSAMPALFLTAVSVAIVLVYVYGMSESLT